MRRIVAVPTVVAALVLTCPSPGASFIDNCIVYSTRVLLHGAVLGAGTLEEARERSTRLGFSLLDDGNPDRGGMPAIPLKEGRLEWSLNTGYQFAMLDARAVAPRLHSTLYRADGRPKPDPAPVGGDRTMGHANHATRLVGVIGIVSEIQNAIENVEMQSPFRERVPILSGRTYELEELGALACDAPVAGDAFVRLIAPKSANSRCAAWRGAGFGRWIGLVFESDDVEATASWFESHAVPFTRSGWGLALDPEATGGVYVEFVGRGTPRRS